MKKVIIVLWALLAIAVLLFLVSIFTMSTQTTWQMFTIAVIFSQIAFWGTVILLVFDYIRKKKDDAV